MALYLIAIPIGNKDDIGLRALEILRRVPIIIFEERKEGSAFLRQHSINKSGDIEKRYEQLNEHSTPADVTSLAELCRDQDVALITDCGTPGFADPGADLVRACRKLNVPVTSIPGASSLMTILSLTSKRLNQFVYRGFLSAETEQRGRDWKSLQPEKQAIVLMDTPYRLGKTLTELIEFFPQRQILLGLNLTQTDEQVLEGKPVEVSALVNHKKAEFIVLIYPAIS